MKWIVISVLLLPPVMGRNCKQKFSSPLSKSSKIPDYFQRMRIQDSCKMTDESWLGDETAQEEFLELTNQDSFLEVLTQTTSQQAPSQGSYVTLDEEETGAACAKKVSDVCTPDPQKVIRVIENVNSKPKMS